MEGCISTEDTLDRKTGTQEVARSLYTSVVQRYCRNNLYAKNNGVFGRQSVQLEENKSEPQAN